MFIFLLSLVVLAAFCSNDISTQTWINTALHCIDPKSQGFPFVLIRGVVCINLVLCSQFCLLTAYAKYLNTMVVHVFMFPLINSQLGLKFKKIGYYYIAYFTPPLQAFRAQGLFYRDNCPFKKEVSPYLGLVWHCCAVKIIAVKFVVREISCEIKQFGVW